ncbi:helix-turn-helix domain-containing protein [Longitalea luteola]|uniref:helix-turn-helix domain-containing protein n=1 Tax=Longitalea luteola TaxID=2812563 RepID=UPI001A962315|nr:AraC family transcriptional regulator [Longitalea luteola]
MQCLEIMTSTNEYVILNSKMSNLTNYKKVYNINIIIEFTLASFHQRISLNQVATLACMSVSAFCHYFKRCMQKTYIDYLNEVRLRYACEQLLQTNKPVKDIGFESGYNTITYFHRQFLRIYKITPLQYRNQNKMPSEAKVIPL